MTKFIYKAKQGPGPLIDGEIEADHLEGAIRKITQLGFYPVHINPESEKTPSQTGRAAHRRTFPWKFSKKISSLEIATFTRQMYVLTDSGVPLLKALQTILNQRHNSLLKKIVSEIAADIEQGANFSSALARHEIFSRLYVSMIKAGELSGQLALILRRLADFTLKDEEARAQVKTSLYYPGLVLAVGCLTVFILLTFVIPHLTAIFEDLNERLPLPTAILIGLSNFLSQFWWLLAAGLCFVIYTLKKIYNLKTGRLWFDQKILRIPLVGNFLREAELGRFSRTLATLIKSGVTIISALEVVSEIVDNEVLKIELQKVLQDVKNGSSLSVALSQDGGFFPSEALSIIAIGEESGHLDHGLNNLADSYERQTELSIKAFMSLLGPFMILLIGCVVAFIVFAMALPIFRMNLLIK